MMGIVEQSEAAREPSRERKGVSQGGMLIGRGMTPTQVLVVLCQQERDENAPPMPRLKWGWRLCAGPSQESVHRDRVSTRSREGTAWFEM